MGGKERVARQHKGGRLTVRERIDHLLDPGTFKEIGSIAGKATYDAKGNIIDFMPGNCVFGRGTVEGRPVVVAGDDFTLRGGSADASIKGKPKMSEQIAAQFRMPIIRLIEGSGGGGSVKTIETTGRANLPGGLSETTAFDLVANNMAEVPVVGLGLGSVAGLGAARLVAAHYSIMVKEIAAVFVAGPPVVERLGEPRTKQELGGWEIQLGCGAVDEAVDTEDDAFEMARRFLSYLPSSIHDVPPDRHRPAGPEAGVFDAPHHFLRIRQKQFFRDGPNVRPLDHHGVCSSRRLAGRGDGGRSVVRGRCLERRCL
jgi:acetyl-CoA carboxylase carboxyltransferase component